MYKTLTLYNYLRFLLSQMRNRGRDVVFLMIHGVSDKSRKTLWEPLRARMEVKRLETLLAFLTKNYEVVSIDDSLEILAGRKKIRRNAMVTTFDDGYKNNLELALPILRRFGIVPTIYIVTGQIDRGQPFWFDRLDYALQQVELSGRAFQVGGKKIIFHSNRRKDLVLGYRQLRLAAKQLPRRDINMVFEMEKMAEMLETEAGRSLVDFWQKDLHTAPIGWEEIQEAGKDGVIFGSHTVDHFRLGLADELTAYRQLSQSRETIRALTGLSCRHLCYPSGSFSEQTVKIARRLDYQSGVTTIPGLNRVENTDPWRIRRVYLPETGSWTSFLGILAGGNGFKFKRPGFLPANKEAAVVENILGD